jgi:hypothetical protein
MFKSYFKSAYRQLLNNRLFTTVNIAVATAGFQAIKAAMTNPVKSLRTE